MAFAVTTDLTAAMLEPYATDPDNRGGVLFTTQRLSGLIRELDGHGIDLHLHAAGDRAARNILDAVEQARAALGRPLRIEITASHLFSVAETDIERFRALDVHANFTPHWFGGAVFGEAREMNVGAERAGRSQLVGRFFARRANVTLSSDVIHNARRVSPFIGIETSMTRREMGDAAAVAMPPADAAISLGQALAGYTVNGAAQLGLEEELGCDTGRLSRRLHRPAAGPVRDRCAEHPRDRPRGDDRGGGAAKRRPAAGGGLGDRAFPGRLRFERPIAAAGQAQTPDGDPTRSHLGPGRAGSVAQGSASEAVQFDDPCTDGDALRVCVSALVRAAPSFGPGILQVGRLSGHTQVEKTPRYADPQKDTLREHCGRHPDRLSRRAGVALTGQAGAPGGQPRLWAARTGVGPKPPKGRGAWACGSRPRARRRSSAAAPRPRRACGAASSAPCAAAPSRRSSARPRPCAAACRRSSPARR